MGQETSDEQLLAAFVQGDRKAFGELAGRYERSLLGLALGLLHGREDLARDAVQESWVRVLRFAAGFNSKSSVKTWLYRITMNQCKDILTLARKTDALSRNAATEKRRDAGASGAAMQADNEQLQSAVAELDDDKRNVLLLCYNNGMTHTQAAEVLDIPLGTLKSRLHAALNELRSRLGPEVES